jgi:hypothetical protein
MGRFWRVGVAPCPLNLALGFDHGLNLRFDHGFNLRFDLGLDLRLDPGFAPGLAPGVPLGPILRARSIWPCRWLGALLLLLWVPLLLQVLRH